MASERCNVSMDYLKPRGSCPKSFLYTPMLTSSPTRTIEETCRCPIRSTSSKTNIIRNWRKKATV
ncbi:MAG: hypothetical protein ACLSFT_08000 [Ruminococcus callidus]